MKIADLPAIESSALVKRYGQQVALNGLDLGVPLGGVYALLGPNGAGKTTAVRILATLSRPDAGEARVLGHDVVRDAAAVRARVSLTGQHASVDADLTGAENLRLIGRLLGLRPAGARRRAAELLDAFDLGDAGGRQVSTYSGGMRRRLDLAASLVVAPELLFLDEPTTGLDPRSRRTLWGLVRQLVAAGTTVLLTTQYLDEADQLADRIGVIDGGRLVAEGSAGQLKASVGAGVLHLRLADPSRRPEAAQRLSVALGVDPELPDDPLALSARLPDPTGAAALVDQLQREGIAVAAFSLGQPTLDEVFLALTGHTTTEEAPA